MDDNERMRRLLFKAATAMAGCYAFARDDQIDMDCFNEAYRLSHDISAFLGGPNAQGEGFAIMDEDGNIAARMTTEQFRQYAKTLND